METGEPTMFVCTAAAHIADGPAQADYSKAAHQGHSSHRHGQLLTVRRQKVAVVARPVPKASGHGERDLPAAPAASLRHGEAATWGARVTAVLAHQQSSTSFLAPPALIYFQLEVGGHQQLMSASASSESSGQVAQPFKGGLS